MSRRPPTIHPTIRSRRALPAPLLGLLLLPVLACDDGEPPPPRAAAERAAGGTVVRDLVREFPAAISQRELAVIDLGTPEARSHLIRGWGRDERDDERDFVWGLGEVSELELYAAGPTELTLVLHCRAFSFERAPRQIVTVALNGREVAEVEVGALWGRHRVRVPADALRRGPNRLSFGYGYSRNPSEVAPAPEVPDERLLAVQWDSIELRGLGSEGPPRLAGGNRKRIELPLGTEVAYYLDLEPGWELVIGELTTWGRRHGAALLVEVETAAGRTSQRVDPGTAELPIRVPLASSSRELGRLVLSAGGEDGAGSGGGLLGRLRGGRSAGVSVLLPMVMASVAPASVAPASAAPASGATDGPPRPDVLVYLIDTLRADRLGVYGYGRPTSPCIDRFAADGAVFLDAQAQSSWTRSAMVSIMTGLLPQTHGVNRRDEALSRSVDTLAELLKRAGYETQGFITNGNVGPNFGLGQGFDHYRYFPESKARFEIHRLSDHLNRHVFPWLEERGAREDRKPFFLYLHATDPHAPYTPPAPFRGRFAAGVDPRIGRLDNVLDISTGRKPAPPGTAAAFSDLYDAEIAFNDDQFGRLIAKLESLGLYDSTLIVLVSDHGEEFNEHGGWEHGKTLYGEQLRVPLVLKLPGGEGAGRRIDELADQVDILPTILDVVGVEPPHRLDGRSLVPLLRGARRDAPSYSYLELEKKRLRSVLARGWKLIVDDSRFREGDPLELYRVETDPLETRQLQDRRLLMQGYLQQTLRALELDLRRGSRRFAPEQAEVSEEVRKRLEALGYVD